MAEVELPQNFTSIAAVFKRFDLDGDGMISRGELAYVLRRLDKKQWTMERIEQVLNLIDSDGDGQIDMLEFLEWIFEANAWNKLPDPESFRRILEGMPNGKLAQVARQREQAETMSLAVTTKHIDDIRHLRKPPTPVRLLCQVLVHLIYGKLKSAKPSWEDLQKKLQDSVSVQKHIRAFPARIENGTVPQVHMRVSRHLTENPTADGERYPFTVEYFSHLFWASGPICEWVLSVIDLNGLIFESHEQSVPVAIPVMPLLDNRMMSTWSASVLSVGEAIERADKHFSRGRSLCRRLSADGDVYSIAKAALNDDGLRELSALHAPHDGCDKICSVAMHLLAAVNPDIIASEAGIVDGLSWSVMSAVLHNTERFLESLKDFKAKLASGAIVKEHVHAARDIDKTISDGFVQDLMRMRMWTVAGLRLWCAEAILEYDVHIATETGNTHLLQMSIEAASAAGVDLNVLVESRAALKRLSDSRQKEYDAIRNRYLSPDSLWEILGAGDVVLVRASTLFDLAARNQILPRRQDLQTLSFWDPKDLEVISRPFADSYKMLPIIVISYCWLTASHPDPKGAQLRTIVDMLRLFEVRYKTDAAVFMDWCSLYQMDRDEMQQASFRRSLESINMWYGHQMTITWLMTELPPSALQSNPYILLYRERGWPTFERGVSEMLAGPRQCMDLGFRDKECSEYVTLEKKCAVGRRPPLTPEAFNRRLESTVFTSFSDHAVVAEIYRQTFTAVMGYAKDLRYSQLQWTDADAVALASILPSCTELRLLELWQNKISDGGSNAIAAVLGDCLALEELHIQANCISREGVRRLQAAWASAGKSPGQLLCGDQRD